MIWPTKGAVNYAGLLNGVSGEDADIAAFLLEELPYVWREAYAEMTSRQVNIVRWTYGTFEYLFDDYASLEAKGLVPPGSNIESRLLAAIGRSEPHDRKRDDFRLKGWVGPTERTFGKGWDKGHFIAHSIGGVVDGLEANVFVQLRSLNRGWSAAGKRFREMEQYCVSNRGTICFSRPIYVDETSKPAIVEFGVLKGRELWVERFDNFSDS